MGPWDGTYEGIAIPDGEIEEQEGMTFAFQTKPNGTSLPVAAVRSKCESTGRGSVVHSLTKMDVGTN